MAGITRQVRHSVGEVSLRWFSKTVVPPGVVNLLIRWPEKGRWAYSLGFNMGNGNISMLECRDTAKGPKYDDCWFLEKEWEWAVLPTNAEWDELMTIKGYGEYVGG